MSTQTKLLSAATVLATLSDNDKIVAVTQAGNTGLVTKDTLKDEIAGPAKRATLTLGPSVWMRVAEFEPNNAVGIVLINNTYNLIPGAPLIIQVGCSHEATNTILIASSGACDYYDRVRLVYDKFDGVFFLDVRAYQGQMENWYHSRAFGIGVKALTPALAPSVDGARWVREKAIDRAGGVETT